MNRSKLIRTVILLVSFLNLGYGLKTSYHTDFFRPNGSAARYASVERAKEVLTGMGLTRAGYTSEGTPQESGYDYYDVQNAIAPIVLHRNSQEDPVIIFHAEKSHHIGDVQGFVMIEDVGNDLALFRKR